MIKNTQCVLNWGVDRQGDPKIFTSMYTRLAADKQICKQVMLLSGCFLGATESIHEFVDRFRPCSFLWEYDMQEECRQFLADNPSLERIDDELHKLDVLEKRMKDLGPTTVGVIRLEVS